MRKNIVMIGLAAAAALTLGGCGDDRSHPSDEAKKVYGSKEVIPFITETEMGKTMRAHNFVYIPGGFDVDGDGQNEGGFWLAQYEARDGGGDVNLSSESNISAIIKANFKAFAGNGFTEDINTSTYTDASASDIGLSAIHAVYNNNIAARNNISAIEAILSLKHSQIDGGYSVSLPLEKEWMQLVKLAINNPANWTGGMGTGILKEDLVFANGLLGNDTNVDANYTAIVHELPGGLSEWTRGAFTAADRMSGSSMQAYSDINVSKVPSWWLPRLKDTNTTLTTVGGYYGGIGSSPVEDQNINLTSNNNGAYAVTARGGLVLDKGLSAAWVQHGFGSKVQDIGFRGASAYIKSSHYPYELQ